MTICEYFKCPICGKHYTVKLQMDNTFKLYDWPIHVSCLECGNEIDLIYNSNGLQPSNLKTDEAETSITFGYSAVLPLTRELYFKELDRGGRLAALTPFMSLSSYYGRFDIAPKLGKWIQFMMNTLIPCRHYIRQLLPIISHKPCNVSAYSAKLASLIEAQNYNVLKDEFDCLDSFVELHEAIYRNFAIDSYKSTDMYKAFIFFQNYLEKEDIQQIEALEENVNQYMNIESWLWTEVFPIVADIVNEIQVLFPSMSFIIQGKFYFPTGDELFTMTVGYKKLDGWYARAFEALVHGLPFFVGLNNTVKNGNADTFVVNGQLDNRGLSNFSALPSASKINAIKQDNTLSAILVPVLNNHIRNAIQHGGDLFLSKSQTVEYHFDQNDNTKHDDYMLIDVGYMVFMQLMHLLEAIMLVSSCYKRLRTK